MLVGRASEQQAIARLIAGARLGHSGALVLVGDAGIGKTTVLDNAVAAADGMCVLRASGRETERDLAFAGLHQLLLPVLDTLPRIPPPQQEALGVALALRGGRGRDRFAVGAATLSLVTSAAEQKPVLLVVDDAHLWDRASAEAVAFLGRRLLADRVGLLVAARPDTSSPLLDVGLPTVRLDGLPLESVPDLLALHAKQTVPQALARRLHRATGGNPLALVELADDLDGLRRLTPGGPVPVPAALLEAFTRRAAGLGDPARTLLLVAAVADGDLAVVDQVAASLQLPVGDLASAEAAGLARLTPGRVDFRHPLARASVYAAADPELRRRVHRAVAAALPASDLERRTWNLCEAALGVDDAVAADLVRVGERARDRGAHADAATAFERAALLSGAEQTRAEKFLAAGEAAWLAGQADRAETLLSESARLAGGPGLRTGIVGLRGTIALRAGSVRSALAVLLDGADACPNEEPDAAVVLLGDAVTACFYLADGPAALAVRTRIDGLLPRGLSDHIRIRGELFAGIAEVLAGSGGTDRIRDAVADLLALPELEDDQVRPAWMVVGTLFLRESDTGRLLVQHAVDELRAHCALAVLPNLLFHTARDDATTDRWDAAVSGYTEGVSLAREGGQTTDLAMNLAGLAWIRARRGDEQACRRGAAEAVVLAERHQVWLASIWSAFALADLEMALTRPQEALVHLDRLEQLLDELGLGDVDLSPGPERAEVLHHLGRTAEAAAAASAYHSRAREKTQPWALARAERALGITGDPAHFATALELHRASGDSYEKSRTLLAHGSALRRERRRVDARPPLRAALAGFERLGARTWADLAAAELDATGETVVRRGDSDLDRLTPQELQIAKMLGAGRTTRETAAALFLSPKTVEYHLRHVYTKLSVGSRSELAAALERG